MLLKEHESVIKEHYWSDFDGYWTQDSFIWIPAVSPRAEKCYINKIALPCCMKKLKDGASGNNSQRD